MYVYIRTYVCVIFHTYMYVCIIGIGYAGVSTGKANRTIAPPLFLVVNTM